MPYGTNENGLAGPDVELKINAPIYVNHFQAIADLAKDGTFKYGGRTSEAKQIFLAGECGIYTDSSGGLGDIIKSGMNYGTGPLPYDSDAPGAPQNTIPGGASLWVFGGKSRRDLQGRRRLLQLPVADRGAGVPAPDLRLPAGDAWPPTRRPRPRASTTRTPAASTPIMQMMGKAPTENSKGVRLVNLPQVRDIQNEEFEKMLAGKQTAQQALDNAVTARATRRSRRRSATERAPSGLTPEVEPGVRVPTRCRYRT